MACFLPGRAKDLSAPLYRELCQKYEDIFFPHDARTVVGQGLIFEVSRSHSDTPHFYGSSGQVIGRTQWPLPDKTLNTYTRRTSMPPAGFASERPQRHALRLMHKYHACPCRSPAMPSRAAPLPCSDRAVPFVKVRVIAGNIRITRPAF